MERNIRASLSRHTRLPQVAGDARGTRTQESHVRLLVLSHKGQADAMLVLLELAVPQRSPPTRDDARVSRQVGKGVHMHREAGTRADPPRVPIPGTQTYLFLAMLAFSVQRNTRCDPRSWHGLSPDGASEFKFPASFFLSVPPPHIYRFGFFKLIGCLSTRPEKPQNPKPLYFP